jgi:hypothetical protein
MALTYPPVQTAIGVRLRLSCGAWRKMNNERLYQNQNAAVDT